MQEKGKKEMMNNRLKKVASMVLVTVMIFGGLQVQTKEVQATTVTASDSDASVSEIGNAQMEWVETETKFKPEKVNGGKGIEVQYEDGTAGYVPFSESEQEAGASEGIHGYIIENLSEVEDNIEVGEEFQLTVNYRGKVGTIFVIVVPKKATGMEVVQVGSVLEGKVPKNTDIEIHSVTFNDDSTEESVSDFSRVTVALVDSGIYKAGENVLNVTYMGYTKKITIYAELDQVVSISAEQNNTQICSGDTLVKGDFDVVAYYSSGKIDSNYIDYEIVDTIVTDTTTSVILRTSSGIETIVDLTVTKLEPKRMEVSYNGAIVEEGCQVDKDNFVVILIYNNGRESILEKDAYDLVYDEIIGGRSNLVEVVYKLNPDIVETVYVDGIGKTATESPVPTTTPDDGNIAKETPQPDSTPDTDSDIDNNTESTMEPQSTTDVPVPTKPAEPVSTATAPVAASATPSAVVVSATPGGMETGKNDTLPAEEVPTGSAVISTSAIPVNTDAPSDGVVLKNSKTNLTLGVGEKVKVTMNGATIVTYKTSNSKILTVTSKGKVTAKKVGKAQIVITDQKGNTKTCTITVKKAPKKVKVNFTKKTLKKGKKATIKVSFVKGYYSSTNTFKSSNKKIATVNSKGVITAKKKGTCKITVKTFNGKQTVIKVTVK